MPTSSRNYDALRKEIFEKSVVIKEAINASENAMNVKINGIEITKKSAENLLMDFERFLNSDSKKFKRIFIPLNLINNDVYWKNLQALFNKVYDSKQLLSS